LILPVLVTVTRFLAPEWVLIFGIVAAPSIKKALGLF
jgi:hypothetical protein